LIARCPGHPDATFGVSLAEFWRTIAERNHQGIGNDLIQPLTRTDGQGVVLRRQGMGGMLNFYDRGAA
jgi:hypothetical protein